eukprot:3941432-Rhodomonas_salina.9
MLFAEHSVLFAVSRPISSLSLSFHGAARVRPPPQVECIAKSLSRHKNGRAHVYWSEQSCEVLLSGMRRVLQSSETEERESFKTAVVELKLVGALISGAKSRGVEMLADFLAAFPALEHLDLHCCVLQRDCADAIASGLHASSLTHLDISGTLLGSEGFVPAFNPKPARADGSEQTFGRLRRLDVGQNGLGVEGTGNLAGAFAVCTSLTALNLFGNNVQDQGVELLAKVLPTLSHLSSLSLGCNGVTDVGVKSFCATLPECCSLADLSLRSNKIGETSVGSLEAVLGLCQILKLDMGGNPFKPKIIIVGRRWASKCKKRGYPKLKFGPW